MVDDNTLLAQTLETSKIIHENEKQSWYSGIVFILEELDINLNMGIEEIKNTLIMRSMENWEKQVKENAIVRHGKLHTSYIFKTKLEKEIYLKAIKSRDVRKCFTQFRISAHQLAIAQWKYKNIKAVRNFCQAKEVEDETHFLIKCQKFSFEREELFKSIEKSYKNFKELSDENKFLWLMTTEDIFI